MDFRQERRHRVVRQPGAFLEAVRGLKGGVDLGDLLVEDLWENLQAKIIDDTRAILEFFCLRS